MRVDRAGHEPRRLAGAVSRPAGAVPALTMFGRSSAKPTKVEVFGKTYLGPTRDYNEARFMVGALTRRGAATLHECPGRRTRRRPVRMWTGRVVLSRVGA